MKQDLLYTQVYAWKHVVSLKVLHETSFIVHTGICLETCSVTESDTRNKIYCTHRFMLGNL